MLNATISARQNLTDSLFILKVKPDKPSAPFEAGQYVALGLPASYPRDPRFGANSVELNAEKLVKRAYSLASAPEHPEELEFCIVVVPEGVFTPRLTVLKPGDRIFVAPKIVGHFTLREVPGQKNLIFISTGTGIAPFLSMLRSKDFWSTYSAVTIIHGVRQSKELCYRQELEGFVRQHPGMRYLPTVSRPDPAWQGQTGYVQGFIERSQVLFNPESDHIFVCGNPAMITEVRELAEARGFQQHSKKSPGNLHIEEYW